LGYEVKCSGVQSLALAHVDVKDDVVFLNEWCVALLCHAMQASMSVQGSQCIRSFMGVLAAGRSDTWLPVLFLL
jgi:hypothetical protein